MANYNYISIDVVDTAVLCNLDIKQSTINREEVQARCPYCGDYKYRMYLSHRMDNATFWCHNCGTTGNAVTLYADFNPEGRRLTNAEAYHELLRHPDVRCDEVPDTASDYRTLQIRPLHERSQIYLAFLSLLDLEEKHLRNLLSRGLSKEIIGGNMYRSIPTDPSKRRKVINELSGQFDLSGIPGFYTKNNRWQIANCRYSGILIPVCDMNNQIQGLQIRFDDPPSKIIEKSDGTKIKKNGERFRWFSTGGEYYENGTGISSYIHVVGDIKCDTLHLTEGPMKADIASYLAGGELFIGLTGVQNVRYLAEVVRALHPKQIVECIDMDVRTNPHVQRAQSKIRSICMPLCEDYRTFTWPKEQKGIDDWLLFEKLKRERGLIS